MFLLSFQWEASQVFLYALPSSHNSEKLMFEFTL